MHLRYFCSNQEKLFSIVVVICIVMSAVLAVFLSYHLKMATNNQTTNENYKVEDCQFALEKEQIVLETLLKRT